MNQLQFDLICKILQNGAPVLANELCTALNNLVLDYNKLLDEVNTLKQTNNEDVDEATSTES